MANMADEIRIEKLLRKERGERLFLAQGPGDRKTLVLQIAGLTEASEVRLSELGERLATVRSPQVPALLQWTLKETGLLQLVTPDPSGVFLEDLVDEGRLPVPMAISLWESLLRGLGALHEAGIVYGLMHPSRLLLDRRTHVLLPEVGLVPALADRLEAGMPAAGTLFQRLFHWPELVPPELLRAQPLLPASDVYQSAALFYRLVSGASPYGEGLSVELYNRMLRGQITPLHEHLPDAPRILTTVLDECLASDASARPPDATRLRHRLAELALRREPLGELVLQKVERPYSSRYPGILSVHSGELEPPEDLNADRDLVSVQSVEKEVLLGQLDRLRAQRQGRPETRNWLLWALLGLLALAGVLALPYILELGQPQVRQHEGRLPIDGDGRTHTELAWEGGSPHPTVRSLLASVAVTLRRRLEAAGVPMESDFSFVPPILPPYRLKTTDGTPEVVLEFTARNRLRSIRFGQPRDGIAEMIVLYDAAGAVGAIAIFGPEKEFLRYLGIGFQKDAESPSE